MSLDAPTVTLKEISPYYDLFQNGMVPVKASSPVPAPLLTEGIVLIYYVDLSRLDEIQVDEILHRLIEIRGNEQDTLDEVLTAVRKYGLPLRASEVAVHPALSLRQFV